MNLRKWRSGTLAFVLAILPGASASVCAVADGVLSAQATLAPTTHVEGKTRATCPVIHSPDCVMCRYLSLSLTSVRHVQWSLTGPRLRDEVLPAAGHVAIRTTPPFSYGRAPPVS